MLYNSTVKDYKSHLKINIFENVKESDFTISEELIKRRVESRKKNGGNVTMESKEKSLRRTKTAVIDYALVNEWEYFITLTFNPEKVDSFNYQEVTKKLSNWLHNLKNYGVKDLKYIIVPELHKTGRMHFHGLFANTKGLEFKDSGKTDSNNRIIYNIEGYKLGWTTAQKVDNNEAISRYISKYITKELMMTTKNKKRYWNSRNLEKPSVKKELFTDDDKQQFRELSEKTIKFKIDSGNYQDEIEQFLMRQP